MDTIAVYDKKNYFFRYIKYMFKDSSVTKENNINISKYKRLKRTKLIFVVVYNELDIIPFLFFYRLNKNLVICTDNKLLLSKYQQFHDILCIDISQPKCAFLDDFKEKVKMSYA